MMKKYRDPGKETIVVSSQIVFAIPIFILINTISLLNRRVQS